MEKARHNFKLSPSTQEEIWIRKPKFISIERIKIMRWLNVMQCRNKKLKATHYVEVIKTSKY